MMKEQGRGIWTRLVMVGLMTMGIVSWGYDIKACDFNPETLHFRVYPTSKNGADGCTVECKNHILHAVYSPRLTPREFQGWWAKTREICSNEDAGCYVGVKVRISVPMIEFPDDSWGYDLGCALEKMDLEVERNVLFVEQGAEGNIKRDEISRRCRMKTYDMSDVVEDKVTKTKTWIPDRRTRQIWLEEEGEDMSISVPKIEAERFNDLVLVPITAKGWGLYVPRIRGTTKIYCDPGMSFRGERIGMILTRKIAYHEPQNAYNSTRSLHQCLNFPK